MLEFVDSGLYFVPDIYPLLQVGSGSDEKVTDPEGQKSTDSSGSLPLYKGIIGLVFITHKHTQKVCYPMQLLCIHRGLSIENMQIFPKVYIFQGYILCIPIIPPPLF